MLLLFTHYWEGTTILFLTETHSRSAQLWFVTRASPGFFKEKLRSHPSAAILVKRWFLNNPVEEVSVCWSKVHIGTSCSWDVFVFSLADFPCFWFPWDMNSGFQVCGTPPELWSFAVPISMISCFRCGLDILLSNFRPSHRSFNKLHPNKKFISWGSLQKHEIHSQGQSILAMSQDVGARRKP